MDVDDQSGEDDHFSWNPCNDFNEGSCSGVAVSTLLFCALTLSNLWADLILTSQSTIFQLCRDRFLH